MCQFIKFLFDLNVGERGKIIDNAYNRVTYFSNVTKYPRYKCNLNSTIKYWLRRVNIPQKSYIQVSLNSKVLNAKTVLRNVQSKPQKWPQLINAVISYAVLS